MRAGLAGDLTKQLSQTKLGEYNILTILWIFGVIDTNGFLAIKINIMTYIKLRF